MNKIQTKISNLKYCIREYKFKIIISTSKKRIDYFNSLIQKANEKLNNIKEKYPECFI